MSHITALASVMCIEMSHHNYGQVYYTFLCFEDDNEISAMVDKIMTSSALLYKRMHFVISYDNLNGYTTFYSQLIRFSRLCNNINDFLFRAKLCYIKLVKRGYMHSLLYKYFKKFCLTYKIEEIYGERDHDLFFSRMIEHNPSISCNINNVTDINDIVKACSVIITKLPSNSKDTCINNPPLSTSVIVENTSHFSY